jgi:dTDP-glucose 4,6-dehydratase
MEKILVTGGAGFIGSNFINYILNNFSDVEVINYDCLTYAGNLDNLKGAVNNPKYTFVKGDIRNNEFLEYIIQFYKVDGIINFAAESHVDRSIDNSRPFIETNIGGTLNILEAARKFKIKNIVQVSTDEVYGSLGETGLFTELTPISPNSPYSSSKASADLLCNAFHHTFGMDIKITRCSNNYGPMQFPEKLIPLMINNALEDKDLPVYGDGLNVRDWLYVDDHCSAIWAVYNQGKSGEVYNIGGNNEKTNIFIVKELLRQLGKPESLIKYVKDRPGHDKRYAIDNTKISTELGWSPKVTFEEGLKKTIQWYLDNKEWSQNVRTGTYLEFYNKWYEDRK